MASLSRLSSLPRTCGLWSHCTVFDGLAGMRVEDIYQDSRGFIWIATADGGVSRFDGVHFDNLTTAEGLPHPTATSIVETPDGRLWFATFGGGLAVWNGRTFEVYTQTDGLPCDDLLKLRVADDESVWVMTMQGLTRFGTGRCQERITSVGDQPLGPVYDLIEDSTGRVWLATMQHGVISLDGQQLHARSPDGRDILYYAWGLAQDREGCLWIASNYVGPAGYALRYDPREEHLEVLEVGGAGAGIPTKYGIRQVRTDACGRVWHAFRGLFVFDGTDWQQLSIPLQGGEFVDVRLTYEDQEGNLWLGYWGGGLAFCDPSSLRRFSEEEGLPHREVTALAADREYRVWIGTVGGLASMEGGQITVEPLPGAAPCLVHCLHLDPEGRLWVGTDAGKIYCREGEALQGIPVADERVENAALCADGRGRLWIGQHPPGEVGWLEGGVFRALRQELAGGGQETQGLFGVDAIVKDLQGRIWFGARGDGRALCCLEDGRLRVFGTQDGFVKTHYVHALALSPTGMLWIGTGVGLVSYDGRAFRHFTVADGLPENAITALAFDGEGTLWIGTSGGGAVRFDGQVFQVIRLGNTPGENMVNAVLIDQGRQVWFGTQAGLVAYYPGTVPPRVVFRHVGTDALHRAQELLVCSAGIPEIRIAFQGIGFKSGARQMRYSFRLASEEWSPFTPLAEAVYSGVAPGEYVFEVRAMDRDGLVSEPASLTLVVEPDPQTDRIEALEEALSQSASVETFIGQGPAIKKALDQLRFMAEAEVVMLIYGETGTGKGLAARALHALSRRRHGPFIQVNCGALPEGLIESELFGHERGAFTGATARKLGRFEVARSGTLFLDEVGDLPLGSQAVLLEVLQERSFQRVGGEESIQADVRIIAATNRDLQAAVDQGLFRLDLFYRLNGFTLRLPPLRERQEDIPLLVQHFAQRFARHLNRKPPVIRPEAMDVLKHYTWPGNVRELEHLVQRAVLLCRGEAVQVEDLPLSVTQGDAAPEGFVPLDEYERSYIEKALEATGWVVYGAQGAARLLGIKPEKLRSRMRVLGLKRRG